jgi:hypothetical protein
MEIPEAYSEVPDNAAIPVTLNEWSEFVREARVIVEDITEAEEVIVWGRWRLGKHIHDMKATRGDRAWYGSKMVERLAAEIGLHPKTCYQCSGVYKHFPDEEDYKRFVDELKARGYLTWDNVRNRSLPDIADDSEQVGGEDQQVDTILGVAESAIHRLQRFVENGVPERKRDEVEGAMDTMREMCSEMTATMYRQENTQYSPPEPELLLSAHPKEESTWDNRSMNDFHEWIRTLPCAVCPTMSGSEVSSVSISEVCHFPTSKGAGGSDQRVIPLCHEHHMEQHTEGIGTFWNSYKRQLLDWYGCWMPELFMSILRRSKVYRGGDISNAITEADIEHIGEVQAE